MDQSEHRVDRSEGDVNASPRREAWQAENLDERARAMLDRDGAGFLRQSLSTPCLNALERTEGVWLVDVQGRRYIDLHGNSAHQVGYGHPAVLDAVQRQMESLPFCPRRFANRPSAELAARLGEIVPGDLSKCLFAPGGTSAVGIALKLARAATGRYKTVSFRGSFHGASLDAASVAGEELFHARMGPLMPGAMHVQGPGASDCAFGCERQTRPGAAHPGGCGGDCATELEEVLAREGDIACVIAEPVRATTVGVPPAGYWTRVREACDRHGALLIFDEIPTGLGRTGELFACEHFGVVPDILVLGKGLGGGLIPIAAVVARAGLDVAPELALGHYTHEKSPLGAAAALATLDVIEREGLVARSRDLGRQALEGLRARLGDCSSVRGCRGLGLMLGVEHCRVGGESAESIAEATMYEGFSAGISYKVGGGRIATLFPPLTISEAELGTALDRFCESCERVSAAECDG